MHVVAKLRQKQDMNVQQQGRDTNVTEETELKEKQETFRIPLVWYLPEPSLLEPCLLSCQLTRFYLSYLHHQITG